MRTLIKGKGVIYNLALEEDWGVVICNHHIEKVGPIEEMTNDDYDCVLDRTNQIIAPGFINGHMHMYGVLSHGITTDAHVTEFSSFLDDFWWPYVEDQIDHDLVSITTKWACIEMIQSGITCFMDVLEAPNAIPGALRVACAEVEKAGLRSILTFEACERVSNENGQRGLEENVSFFNETSDNDLVKGAMSIHTLFTGSESFVKQAKKMSVENDMLMHMHLSESVFEPNQVLKKYGKRPVEVYSEWNVLDQNVFASQVVQVTEEEIDLISKSGIGVVSMPLSNCEVGGGVAPVEELLSKGVDVGLGTDGYINNFFEVMRGAFLIHKAHHQNPQVMPAKIVYDMATRMGAKAMGVEKVGEIKVGNFADLITIDVDTPTPINKRNVFDQIILFRNPENVRDVFVNGRMLKKNKSCISLNETTIKEELREVSRSFWGE